MAEPEIPHGTLLLIEYERIKDEQKGRIAFRDSLLYASLAAITALAAGVLPAHGEPALFLLLPAVSVVLGWAYLVNDEKVSAIGRYIRTELAPRLSALSPGQPTVFGWETAHRRDGRRLSRKRLQLIVDLLTFTGAPAVAVVLYWTQGSAHPVLLAVSLVEAVAVAVLAGQIIRYADLWR